MSSRDSCGSALSGLGPWGGQLCWGGAGTVSWDSRLDKWNRFLQLWGLSGKKRKASYLHSGKHILASNLKFTDFVDLSHSPGPPLHPQMAPKVQVYSWLRFRIVEGKEKRIADAHGVITEGRRCVGAWSMLQFVLLTDISTRRASLPPPLGRLLPPMTTAGQTSEHP